jgi:hypothetical protein
MGCNCGKRKPQVIEPQPVPTPVPQTPDEQHTQDMTEYVKTLENNFDDWYNNIDEITPLNDGKTRET